LSFRDFLRGLGLDEDEEWIVGTGIPAPNEPKPYCDRSWPKVSSISEDDEMELMSESEVRVRCESTDERRLSS